MNNDYSMTIQELKLICTIFDTLTTAEKLQSFRPDQAAALSQRLSAAIDHLEKQSHAVAATANQRKPTDEQWRSGGTNHSHLGEDQPRTKIHDPGVGGSATVGLRKKPLKESSMKVKPIAREGVPRDQIIVSKEVARTMSCSLYNVLESTANLLRASSASIFVRDGEEMVSIANVAARLSFPPQIVRHRCLGSLDAEVLGSGIALNQSLNDASQLSSLLIFPVFPLRNAQGPRERAIATVHVENKDQGSQSFDSLDESVLFLASCLIGEIMARIPSFDWLNNFYDPATQHIVAPFVISKGTTLPSLMKSCVTSGVPAKMLEKIHDFSAEVLIKRDNGDEGSKMQIPGLAQLPTLREVRVYIDNLQDSWKKGVTSTVKVTEVDRQMTMELKQVRRELRETQARLNDATERLRLYELVGSDYANEYRGIKAELDTYLRKRDNL